jgi:hypothetical protein
VITDYNEYLDELNKAVSAKPSAVFISTFNLQVGVSARGTVYQHSPTYKLLTEINRSVGTAHVLVGLPSVSTEASSRVQCSAEEWKNIKFRTRENLHLKCWIFKYRSHISALAGGRNLGDSQWEDVSWWLNQGESKKLFGYFQELWQQCKLVKPRVIETLSIQLPNGRLI